MVASMFARAVALVDGRRKRSFQDVEGDVEAGRVKR